MSEKYAVRDMLVLENDLIKTIEVNKESFKIKAPTPKENKQIARYVAILQNGMAFNSFSSEAIDMFTRDAWLGVLIVEHPQWWKTPDECLDEGLKDLLYNEMLA